jgi:pimeloyl-ACP methyl ester carboxylesterase
MNQVALEAEDPGERISPRPAFDRLDELDVPALLAVGEYDIAYERELTKRMAASLPNARSMTLPAVAHLPQLEEPVVVAELIADFVAGLDS